MKAIAIAALGFAACMPDGGGSYEPLVFPAEAELGGTAAVVIDSNYIPGGVDFNGEILNGDDSELYDLSRNRVKIKLRHAGGDTDTTLRAVFPLAVSRLSQFGNDNPGAWAMVALFDLPTDGVSLGPLPYTAKLALFIDDEEVKVTSEEVPVTASIRITGPGDPGIAPPPIAGQPTQFVVPSLAVLEPQDLTGRLRALQDVDGIPPDVDGILPGSVISGLEFDVSYFYPCILNPAVYAIGEAHRANVFAGGTTELPEYLFTQHVVMFDPAGFTLSDPTGAGAVLGEGPILDIVFEENPTFPGCPALFAEDTVTLSNVFAVAPDGSTIIDRRGRGGSPVFEIRWVDTE